MNHHGKNRTDDRERLEFFKELSQEFSLIRVAGKKPIELNWQKYCHERRPFEKIGLMAGENAGIACGPASGILVLDVDNTEVFEARMKDRGWELPRTRTIETGSGKPHYYFKYPGNGISYCNKTFKEWGFDIRGDGGQVVAPGSIHPDTGRPYTVVNDAPIAPAPQWLLDQIGGGMKESTGTKIRGKSQEK